MPRTSRSLRLVEKAEAALLAAIEAYNRPDSRYREETFTILMLNAWELLVKAKLLAESRNDIRALYVYETRTTPRGKPGQKKYVRKNRTGNPLTKSLGRVLDELDAIAKARIPVPVCQNIEGLTVIRDNAIHYYNASPELAKRVLEFGTGSIKNFLALTRKWFDRDLSRYSLYLLPVGFLAAPRPATGVNISDDETRLLNHLTDLMQVTGDDQDFQVAVTVGLEFRKAKPGSTLGAVSVTRDRSATKVTISDDELLRDYPLDYHALVGVLKDRYSDFVLNKNFHEIREPLKRDPRYTKVRLLNPQNPRSSKTEFYSRDILNEFDKHYRRRS